MNTIDEGLTALIARGFRFQHLTDQQGQLSIIVGFYGYYYLYAGNWEYYFSGIWTREPGTRPAASLSSSGVAKASFVPEQKSVGTWIEDR